MSRRISEHTELTGANFHDDDIVEIVDVSDSTDAASGTNKKGKLSSFVTWLTSALAGVFASAAQGDKADTAVQPESLGGAAILEVGTTAGTVAAGDHTHTTADVTGLDSALSAIDGALGALDTGKSDDGHIHDNATTSVAGFMSAADKTKLDGVGAGADVTDATNVAAAGAVMESDTSTVGMGFVIDEDDMASDSATKVPTQQSVKAYVDANMGGGALPVYTRITTPFSTTSTSLVDVTGLSVPLASGKAYRFEFIGKYSVNTSTEGFTLGISAPSSPTDFVAQGRIDIGSVSSTTNETFGISTAAGAVVIVISGTTGGHGCSLSGYIVTSASGDLKLQLATETGGSNSTTLENGIFTVTEVSL